MKLLSWVLIAVLVVILGVVFFNFEKSGESTRKTEIIEGMQEFTRDSIKSILKRGFVMIYFENWR